MTKYFKLILLLLLLQFTQTTNAVGPYCETHCSNKTPCSDVCYADDIEPPLDHESVKNVLLSNTETSSKDVARRITCGIYGVCKHVEPPRLSNVVPAFDAYFWNNNFTIRINNNCYNYAANVANNEFAQPGYAAGNRGFSANRTCTGAIAGANADIGITPISCLSEIKIDETALALVVAHNYDYHWYRRDSNGRWSHKPGSTEATNRDNSNAIIVNPQTADRGAYTYFCGFYKTISRDYIPSTSTHQNKGTAIISGTLSNPFSETQDIILDDSSTLNMKGIVAEILVYSGLPNPKVVISSNNTLVEEIEVMQMNISNQTLQTLTQTHSSEQELFIEPKLGYQGILIHDTKGKLITDNRSMLIKGNIVKLLDAQTKQVNKYDASAYQLERQILDLALSEGIITNDHMKVIESD